MDEHGVLDERGGYSAERSRLLAVAQINRVYDTARAVAGPLLYAEQAMETRDAGPAERTAAVDRVLSWSLDFARRLETKRDEELDLLRNPQLGVIAESDHAALEAEALREEREVLLARIKRLLARIKRLEEEVLEWQLMCD